MPHDYEVIVIGVGPVGATTLGLLGRAGIRVLGIEKDAEHWSGARAVHFDGETMRSLQTLELAEPVTATSRPMEDFRFLNEDNEVLIAATLGQLGDQGWHDDVLFHQPDVERLLDSVINQQDSVTITRESTVYDVDQEADGVRVWVRDAQGQEDSYTARYVISCDGASSPVRRLLGVKTENLGVDDPWLVVDGLLRGAPGIDGDMVFLGRWSRPALWIRQAGERVRMEFKVMPGDDPDELVTPAGIERVSRGVLGREHFTPDRATIYTFRARLAEHWRVGDIFFAGDAAHQAPPLYGQGLCAGMRDAANLAWKLNYVLRGLAGESLLDTYESERKEHARYWVQSAAEMAHLVQTTVPEVAAQRDAHMRANPGPASPPAPPLGPGLHADPADGHSGYLSPQPILADGTRLDDIVGYRFLLAADPRILEELADDVRGQLHDTAEIAVITDPTQIGELLASTGRRATIVRPDHYILGSADDAPALVELLRSVPVAKSATPAR
ncbi:bifunctional 3-(3-hydroxy-phenyl)propionate/3-hydroxycinnamic acid hydroxylase [Gordonia sp. CPCC 205515]|uniref:bifunctional 3-(3-hydroxy-phenyl)propionate/3-hydroxycinnamic acid hydroxylase n=1 Tax=Gordonia sp. CPCC 205515 TaxID=3140791 RepID=UPI003AF33782